MKIIKILAKTEIEAIERAKIELGDSALIISTKKVSSKGFFGIFKKQMIELEATIDENPIQKNININKESLDNTIDNSQSINRIKMLEDMLLTTTDMLDKARSQIKVSAYEINKERIYENNLVQIFYDTLIQNGVLPQIAREILDDIDAIDSKENLNIEFITKVLYSSIINIIGDIEPIEIKKSKSEPQIVAFIGATGVGKTTTIAKITSNLILNNNLEIGLITADTYRIAAIEQLKTYGEILGIDVLVSYDSLDIKSHIENIKNISDIILIDTAGRSHKNSENLLELKEFLNSIPNSTKFLVLSLATRFEDMLSIAQAYENICEYKLIFTKLDETNYAGNILNICYKTGKKLSYITYGQNVPDDIKIIEPSDIAMILLGLEGKYGSSW